MDLRYAYDNLQTMTCTFARGSVMGAAAKKESEYPTIKWFKMVQNSVGGINKGEALLCEGSIKVHSIRASGAAVERANSGLARIHTALRNRMGAEKQNQLCFLNMNRKLIYGTDHPVTDSDSD